MHAFPLGRRLALSRVMLVSATAVLLATPLSTAQAQFGKLKKIGADAIKDYLEVKTVWLSSDLDVPNPFIRR